MFTHGPCIFRSGTELISLFLILFFFCLLLVGRPLQTKPKRFRRSSRKPAYIDEDWRSQVYDLTSHSQDGDHDVISRKKCCHLLSEQTQNVCWRLCSNVSQFLIVRICLVDLHIAVNGSHIIRPISDVVFVSFGFARDIRCYIRCDWLVD